jgi:hypothetical protein
MVSKQETILKGIGWMIKRFLDSGSSAYIAIIEKEEGLF